MSINSFECKPGSLRPWLDYLASLNPSHIELGLGRVSKVLDLLNLDFKNSLVIEVAGTNGKGSTAALIAANLTLAHIKTGLYTSPHLWTFNERVMVDGHKACDDELALAFKQVYDVAQYNKIPLTYFEYTTLAAFVHFANCGCEALVLEIGLGGRLDAVNVLDADLCVITSIGLDHTKILGSSIKDIAHEKAGIIKDNAQVLLGLMDSEALDVIKDCAEEKHAFIYQDGTDFKASFEDKTYFDDLDKKFSLTLSLPKIPEICVACVIKALLLIEEKFSDKVRFKFDINKVNETLNTVSLPGRMQKINSHPDVYLDVAHNPPAALHLAKVLQKHKVIGLRHALIGMLADKDVESVLKIVKDSFDDFYLASLHTDRGENCVRLKNALLSLGVLPSKIHCYDKVSLALEDLYKNAHSDDEIIILGSFVTVSEAYKP